MDYNWSGTSWIIHTYDDDHESSKAFEKNVPTYRMRLTRYARQ